MAQKYNTEDEYLRLPIRTKTARGFIKGYVILCIIAGMVTFVVWTIFLVPVFTKDRAHAVERKFEKFTPIDELPSWKRSEQEKKKEMEEYLKSTAPSESSER